MISIIICSITPSKFSAISQNLRQRLGDEPCEVIGIHDARSLAEGYNRGIRQSRGDILILCHDDIEIMAEDFRERLLSRLRRFDLIGVAGSTRVCGPKWIDAGPPHVFGLVAHYNVAENDYLVLNWGVPARCIEGIRIMDGLFLAGKRQVFERTAFDQETFDSFYLYDIDFTMRASAAGFKLALCTDLMVIHKSLGNFDARWWEQATRFVAKHRASLQTQPKIDWGALTAKVPTKAQAIELLHYPQWSD